MGFDLITVFSKLFDDLSQIIDAVGGCQRMANGGTGFHELQNNFFVSIHGQATSSGIR